MDLSRFMRRYDQTSFVKQLKVKFLIRMHFLAFSLFPPVILYTAYLQLKLSVSAELALLVILPEIVGFLCMIGLFILNVRGFHTLSAHLTVILLFVIVWAVMISAKSSLVSRLDTIVFLPAMLTMVPLVISRRKAAIVIYMGINIVVLYLFVFSFQLQFGLPDIVILDYLFDNTAAFLIVGLISYHIYSTTQSALNKADEDIRERELAEKAASNAFSFLESSFANSPIGIILANEAGIVDYINPAVLSWSELNQRDAAGKSLRDLFSRHFKSESMESIEKEVLEELGTGKPLIKRRVSVTGKGDLPFELSVLVSRNVDEKGNNLGFVIYVSDITQKVHMEEIMIQSEKMVSVGRLAAGMAHEINNPLAAISQNAQLLQNRMQGESDKNRQIADKCGISIESIKTYSENSGIDKSLDAILKSVQRASHVVSNMLGFSRKSASEKTSQDLRELADKTLELAAKSYDLDLGYDFRNISILRDYDPRMPRVVCEAGEIQQVILNILTNGYQAMISSKSETFQPCFTIRIRKEGDMARLEIEDNGPGIDAVTRKRIFEPFFTTKKKGIGTGLGLSISYFIITENHRGSISVESAPGLGAKFTILLPLDPPTVSEYRF